MPLNGHYSSPADRHKKKQSRQKEREWGVKKKKKGGRLMEVGQREGRKGRNTAPVKKANVGTVKVEAAVREDKK